MSGFQGIYINLDRSLDRRQRIERELQRLQIKDFYVRLAAVDGQTLNQRQKFSPYAEGCFRSHMAGIEIARSFDGLTHIIEDDCLLSAHVAPFFSFAYDANLFETFDIVFLGMGIEPKVEQIRGWEILYRQSSDPPPFSVFDLRELSCRSTSSYALGPRGAAKLSGYLANEANRGISTPIDRFIGNLSATGQLCVGVVLPFITSVDPVTGSYSHIPTRMTVGMIQTSILMKSAFFIDANIDGEVLPLLKRLSETTKHEVIAALHECVATRPTRLST